jgi:hypothetical protein
VHKFFYANVQNWTKENVGRVQVTMKDVTMLELEELVDLHFLDEHKGKWINPFRPTDGEVLPCGNFQYFNGLLIKEH